MNIPWEKIPLFSSCPEKDFTSLERIFTRETIPAGRELIREGVRESSMYILVEGRVRIKKSMIIPGLAGRLPGLEGREKVLATLSASDYPVFGEIALLLDDVRSATVETVEKCSFLKTDRDRFNNLLKSNSQAGLALLLGISQNLANTVRNNNQEIIKLTTALALALRRPN